MESLETLEDNAILRIFQSLFKKYCEKNQEFATKESIFKFFYDFKLVDSCGYNIFEINIFLNQLNPTTNEIYIKDFLILIFYIYKMQILPIDNESIKSGTSELKDVTISEINNFSGNQKEIHKIKNNIIKVILDKRDRVSSNTFKYLSPDFNNDQVKELLDYNLLKFCSQYMNSIETNMFDNYAETVNNGIVVIDNNTNSISNNNNINEGNIGNTGGTINSINNITDSNNNNNNIDTIDNNNNENNNILIHNTSSNAISIEQNQNTINNNISQSECSNNNLLSQKKKAKKEQINPILQRRSKPFKLMNISNFNKLIFDFPIFNNFDCASITKILKLFLEDIQENSFNVIKKAFDERLEEDKIKDIFSEISINSKEINFSYSDIALILIEFALKLPSSKGYKFEDAVTFLFETEFKLQKDAESFKEVIQEEEEEVIDYDFIPESPLLDKLKTGQKTEDEIDEDTEVISDLLEKLEKDLPSLDQNILNFMNDKPMHCNTILNNQYKVVPAKFPLERLQVEKDEEDAKKLAEYEKRRIDKAKKAKKRNARDPPPKEIYMDEFPTMEKRDRQYIGVPNKDFIFTLCGRDRLIKNTFKEIISNTNVYPSLIRETLILPKVLPDKIKELIINSYKEMVNGSIEMAIRRLERAEYFLKDFTINDYTQIDLFFKLNFGFFYNELGYTIQALKYYFNAKLISDKLMPYDPDKALIYCFLGAIFLENKEFKWSLRCFQKAKEIREDKLGGDTLDTAAIYNNLGVVSFFMESFLPAKNYINLAYEITKSILGILHPRTIFIKRNLRKLDYLSFNKEVTFKTLSLYPTPTMLITNPKKKKKGKKK